MAGNIREWTSDFCDDVKDWKVLRGGSWYFNAELARCPSRYFPHPFYRATSLGFRCARTL